MQGMMTNVEHPRPRGRPPKHDEAMLARINIRVPKPVMEAIEAVRAERKDGADVAQVIRELLVEALEERRKL